MRLTNYQYKHSNTFAVLASTTETLNENLSTVQYMRILDGYLYRALAPIVDGTNHADRCFTELLAWNVDHGKRRLAMDSTVDYPALIFQFLMTPREPRRIPPDDESAMDDTKISDRLLLIKSMKLDRAFLLYVINSFLDPLLGTYVAACNSTLNLPPNAISDTLTFNLFVKNKIEEAHDVDRSLSLLGLIQQTQFWRDRHLYAKRVVLEKYVRSAISYAQKDYQHYFKCEGVTLDDLSQIYLIMAGRAIDRCDSDQGTLTTMVLSWMLTGRSAAQKHRQSDTFGDVVGFDELEDAEDEAVTTTDEHNTDSYHDDAHVNALIALADPTGLGRYLLGLGHRPSLDADPETVNSRREHDLVLV